MILALDTNVAIEVMRGRALHYRTRLAEAHAAGHETVMSSVVAYELTRGALRSSRSETRMAEIAALKMRVLVEAFDDEDAFAAARVQVELERSGRGIGVFDRLIAGQALQRGWGLVTANLREFTRVSGLQVIDWSDPVGPVVTTGGD